MQLIYIGRFLVILLLTSACNNSVSKKEMAGEKPELPVTDTMPAAKRQAADAAGILARKEVPILCYHQIRDYKESDSKVARAYIVPGDIFRQQMQALADSGYQGILPDQLYDYLLYGTPLPEKPVMITFDDTRLDQYTEALPALEKHGFKAAFFIMTVSLGKPGYMSRDQVAELARKGHSIGSHTWDHQNVKKYQAADWINQIDRPSRQLKEITGQPTEYFAYPFGLWNPQAIPELKKRGLKMAFQLADKPDPNDPLFTVRRIIVPGSMSGSSMLKAMRNSF